MYKLLLLSDLCQFAQLVLELEMTLYPLFTGAQSLKSSGASSVKTAKIVAVAQSKLTFIKPVQTGNGR